ncbi:MAG: hypothetical protein GX126_03070 [Bacteroidales bacterium]|nr:hypothetical protein [Bacteroidales bacterium]
MFRKLIILFLSILSVTAPIRSYAQKDTTLTREVEVIKPYNPAISDANKISSMPEAEEPKHEKPSFTYSIFSQPVFNTFSVNTLKAAAFASQPKEDTGFGLIRAGAGNYNRPYGELFFNSRNMKNTIFGLHGKHLSSHGKLNLEGGDKVDAPFSDNEAEMYIKHFFNRSLLTVNIDFSHNGFNYYGYPKDSIPSLLKDEDQEINYLGQRQTFTRGGFNLSLENASAGKNDFTFDFDFDYDYFKSKTGQTEHYGKFLADIKKPYYKGAGLLTAGVNVIHTDNIFNPYLMGMGKNRQIWITAQPSFMIGGDVANLQIGAKGWFVLDSSTDALAKLAPVVKVNFMPVEEIINIFAGIDGNYSANNYSKIAYENPYIDPRHHVHKNTFERFRFYGGFDGKLAPKTNFKISADYSMFKNKPLYYLFKYMNNASMPSSYIVDNDFDVIYDNLDLLKFNLEIFHASFEKMNLLISGNYYVYKMESMQEAWNLPDWDAKLSLEYKASEQLSVGTSLFFTGSRNALIYSYPGEDPRPLSNADLLQLENLQTEKYTLEPIFDLNFNADYKVTDKFSVFVHLNNFAFNKYQHWLGYPVQSFNVLGGLGYAF